MNDRDRLQLAIQTVRDKIGFVPSANRTRYASHEGATHVTQPRPKKKRKYNERHKLRSREFLAKIAAERSGKASTVPIQSVLDAYSEEFKQKHGIRLEKQRTLINAFNQEIAVAPPLLMPRPAPAPAVVPAPCPVLKAVEVYEGVYTAQRAMQIGLIVTTDRTKYKDSGAWFRCLPE